VATRRLKISDVDENDVEVQEKEQMTYFQHGDLRPAPGNRSNFNPDKLEELAISIAGIGLIHALLVRPIPGGHEIVAGERRWRAWTRAGVLRAELNQKRAQEGEQALPALDTVPCVVRVMSDEQAIQARCVENAQREDVTPLDEAHAYQELVALGRTQADVAAMVGRTRVHVSERLSLLRLCPEAVEMLTDGRLPVTHCTLLSSLPGHATQREALAALVTGKPKPPPARAFQHALQERYFCRLSGSTFSLKDVKPWPERGACTACPKRAGNCREQYPGIHDDNICVDPPCFHEKLKIATSHRIAQAQKSGAEILPPAALDGLLKGKKLRPEAPYVELSSLVPQDKSGRTWATVAKQAKKIGAAPKALAAVTPSGRVMMVAEKAKMVEALAALSGASKQTSPERQAPPSGASNSARAIESVCRTVALAAAKRAGEHGLSQTLLQLAAESMAASGLDTEGATSLVTAIAKAKDYDFKTALGRLGVADLQAVIAVLAIEFASGFEAPQDGQLPAIIKSLAAQLRLDTDKMLQEAAGE